MIWINMKTIAITIEEDMLKRIDTVAAGSGRGQSAVSRSKFIREAIRHHLTHLERESEEARERQILKRHKGKLRRQAVALIKEQAKP
jgi:metal-responsive CopG/Arc/MetJ family transcriptional regulator